MTRFELGYWTSKKMHDPAVRLAVGTDGGFNLWSTIAYDLEQDIPSVHVQPSLRETCDEALRLLSN